MVVVNANINDRKPTNDLTFSDLDKELREYAISHDVPIIQDDGLAMLESIIRIKRPKKILEIGCAIGYSAIRMASVLGSIVYTIERNEEMYNQAIENVKKANLSDKIHIIFKDALEAYDYKYTNDFHIIDLMEFANDIVGILKEN